MNWNEIVDKVTPFIVKIDTPQGYGTGFLCLHNAARTLCGIATAYHVVAHIDQWQEPVRVKHFSSASEAFLRENERVIFTDPTIDSAVMLVPTDKLKLPKNLIPLRPIENRLPIGVEVGWLGFPAIGPSAESLCFFAGSISAWQEHKRAYLIDGVTINGTSGGPVLYASGPDGVQIVGAVSAYIVNRATGEALPGLSVAQDISHFHAIAEHIRTVDEGERRKREQAAAQRQASGATPEEMT